MIELLPCSGCQALCCGPVALSGDRMAKIRAYVETLPQQKRQRLAAQRRNKLDCGFLDKENSRCAIYPVRPWVCEAFGRVEGMRCPKVSGLVQIVPSFLAKTRFEAEYESGVELISSDFDWLKKRESAQPTRPQGSNEPL